MSTGGNMLSDELPSRPADSNTTTKAANDADEVWIANFWHLLIIAVVCFGTVGVLLALASYDNGYSNLPVLLFFCGASGAVVANYRRVAKIAEQRFDAGALGVMPITLQFYVSALIGGMFALALWAAFYSGIIQGVVFPKLKDTDKIYTGVRGMIQIPGPERFSDAMKGILWSFIAGYSEKLIPNTLDRLSDEAEKKKD